MFGNVKREGHCLCGNVYTCNFVYDAVVHVPVHCGSVNGTLESLSEYVNLVSVAYPETACFYGFYGLIFCSLFIFLVHE